MTGKITSPILVAQHLRATFCTNEWLMEHVDSRINEMVVMYLPAAQVIRPSAPPDVSVCKGIMSCFSFLILGVPRHYVKRLGQKTSSQSHHQQGFGIVRKG